MVPASMFSEEDVPVMQADPGIETVQLGWSEQAVHGLVDVDRCEARLVPEGRVGRRRDPDREHRVPGEVRHDPAVLLHRPEHRFVVPVHERAELLGIQGLRQGGVMLRVREQAHAVDGLADGAKLPEVFHQLIDDVLGEVMLEGFPDLLLFLLRVEVVADHAADKGERSLEKERDGDGIPDVTRLELKPREGKIEASQTDDRQRGNTHMEPAAEYSHQDSP